MTQKPDFRETLREVFPERPAPSGLRAWAAAAARSADDHNDLTDQTPQTVHSTVVASTAERARTRRWTTMLQAASLILACGLGWGGASLFRTTRDDATSRALVAAIVDNHVRSLMAEHLTDVRSTDQHTVKPWFAGKTDFAPRVADPAAAGFPLLGGRMEYVHGRDAAALVYGRRKHFINLYEWPAAASAAASRERVNGYSILHWNEGGLEYWAISDAAAADLDAFRSAFETAR